MKSRIDEATQKQMSGYNCSQAIACTYCDYADMDESKMQDTRNLVNMFTERNTEVTCKKLKGIETGNAIRSCKDCVRDVAEFLEDILDGNEGESEW